MIEIVFLENNFYKDFGKANRNKKGTLLHSLVFVFADVSEENRFSFNKCIMLMLTTLFTDQQFVAVFWEIIAFFFVVKFWPPFLAHSC